MGQAVVGFTVWVCGIRVSALRVQGLGYRGMGSYLSSILGELKVSLWNYTGSMAPESPYLGALKPKDPSNDGHSQM